MEAGEFQAVEQSGYLPLAADWIEARLADKQKLDWLPWFKVLRARLEES